MTVGEAVQLVKILGQDTTSWAYAALAKWDHPASREFFALADIFDAYGKVRFRHPKPYPRPTPDKSVAVERMGEPIKPADIADVLRAFGRPVPDEIAQLAAAQSTS